jgi:DNA mismatch endonuclease, patch repair protein
MTGDSARTPAPARHIAVPSSASVSARMSRQGRRDTEPELALRRELHRLGLRYRVDHPLPGMLRRRAAVHLAVFVDGCFWHACPEHATQPASNATWWSEKLKANVARDRDTDARLIEQGWCVLRFWEHADMRAAADTVEDTWRRRRGDAGLSQSGSRSTPRAPAAPTP